LKLFIQNRDRTISYEDIMVAVWEDSFEREISINSVKNQVSQLRKKLYKDAIVSVYGQGYIFK
jgi:DNA-binding response OmpR family regulator